MVQHEWARMSEVDRRPFTVLAAESKAAWVAKAAKVVEAAEAAAESLRSVSPPGPRYMYLVFPIITDFLAEDAIQMVELAPDFLDFLLKSQELWGH